MKFLFIVFLFAGINCFGQAASKPVYTKMDTLKANVAFDSTTTVNMMEDFKNSVFKKLNSGTEYEFLKQLIDEFMTEKRKRWEAYIKQNSK